VRVEGQMACRSCTGACIICGSPCIHGDEACSECVTIFAIQPWVVPA
jgi:hypothetical protein